MRLYFGARYRQRQELLELAELLQEYGFEITSRWLWESVPYEQKHEAIQAHAELYAIRDLEDIAAANLVVLFTDLLTPEHGSTLGGPYVEQGIALGVGCDVVVVGPRTNVFTYLPAVRWFQTKADFVRWALEGFGGRADAPAAQGAGGRVIDFGAAAAARRGHVGPEILAAPFRGSACPPHNAPDPEVGPVEHEEPTEGQLEPGVHQSRVWISVNIPHLT